jgi:hypothetical protein
MRAVTYGGWPTPTRSRDPSPKTPPGSTDTLADPAARCIPIDGRPYDQVPTERSGVTPAWKVEEPVYFGTQRGPARIVHRGSCRAARDLARPTAPNSPHSTDTRRRHTLPDVPARGSR